MSLVLLAFLLVYGALRVALWLRGQWRFYRLRGELPRAAARVHAPAHLGDAFDRSRFENLLGDSHAGRARLVASARQIGTVLIVDPDVPLGCVRDFRYRLALADAWSAASAWLRRWDALSEHERRWLEELGYTPRQFGDGCAALALAARRSVRAPALEPFAVDDVRLAERHIIALVADLERCERAVSGGSPAGPYRGLG